MDYFSQFLISSIISLSLEFIAAISGSYYLNKNLKINTANRFLVYFLWLTFFFDLIGSYSPIAYFSNYEYFGFICDTGVFEYNYWWFNIFMLISYSFFVYYFTSFLMKSKIKQRMKLMILFYLIIGIGNLIFSDIFFNGYSIFSSTSGTLIVLFSIFIFFFDLLKRDIVLSLKKHLPIYIAVGVLVYNLTVTPTDIFSQYFEPENDLYVKLSGFITIGANIIMYTTFIIGFLVCAKNKKENLDVL